MLTLKQVPSINTIRDVDLVATSQSRDVVSKCLGLISVSWKRGKVSVSISDWKSNVSVSYHRVSFTSQYAQLFASLQNCTYIVLNARRLYCLLIHKFYINSFNLNVAIHCFGTMLKVEGLKKRPSLGLARSRSRSRGKNQTSRSRGIAGRSWSRSHLGPKTECLGLVS